MGNPNLKNNLKVFRARNDLTQADLAERIGVTRKTINVPSTVLALRLAHAFGVSVEELFELE